jgi:uncharacterized protein (UPF0335 family)
MYRGNLEAAIDRITALEKENAQLRKNTKPPNVIDNYFIEEIKRLKKIIKTNTTVCSYCHSKINYVVSQLN